MDLSVSEIYELFLTSGKVSVDTRTLRPGELFWALKGDHFDGNSFANKALNKGAAYAIVDRPELRNQERMVFVENSLLALQEMARMHRRRFSGTVLAITGSNGKTTTKELIKSVLDTELSVIATTGNLNNHIGVPLTILRLDDTCDVGVIEMGANHQGEISLLCKIAEPAAGIITNIGRAHLEGFGGFEGVKKAKGEMYDHLRKINGKAFVNEDDELLMNMSSGIDKITFGERKGASISGKLLQEYPGLEGEISIDNVSYHFASTLYGKYNFSNILVAAAVGNYFSIQPAQIVAGIQSYHPANLRSQIIETGRNKVYMDAYNANPTSMAFALEFFSRIPETNKTLILGDMLELGEESSEEHRKVLKEIERVGFQEVILVGPEFSHVSKPFGFYVFEGIDEAGQWLKDRNISGRTVLIKASRGLRLEELMIYL